MAALMHDHLWLTCSTSGCSRLSPPSSSLPAHHLSGTFLELEHWGGGLLEGLPFIWKEVWCLHSSLPPTKH